MTSEHSQPVIEESPEEIYQRDLANLKTAEEMIQRFYDEISKKEHDIDHELEIDERYADLQEELLDKQLIYDDVDFPSGSSSMVNNSRKTNKPYVNLKWMPLHEIYQVRVENI